MLQVPASARVTVAPDIVQTPESDAKVTASPDDAVALTVNGAVPTALFGRVANVIVWVAWVTVKAWSTAGATAYVLFPACVASIVQVPTLTSVTVEPDTVQTGRVEDEKVTARFEDAVAVNLTGVLPNGVFERAANVMVWVCGVTVKLWSTGVAAAKPVLPACEAWIVQVPAVNSFTVPAATVHTGNVVEVKVTARPEDAVALNAKGAVPMGWSASAPNVMVWAAPVTVNFWLTMGAAA